MPTSIETLDPDSDVLTALLTMKPRTRASMFHSIIGSLRPERVSDTRPTASSPTAARTSTAVGVGAGRSAPTTASRRTPQAIREVPPDPASKHLTPRRRRAPARAAPLGAELVRRPGSTGRAVQRMIASHHATPRTRHARDPGRPPGRVRPLRPDSRTCPRPSSPRPAAGCSTPSAAPPVRCTSPPRRSRGGSPRGSRASPARP